MANKSLFAGLKSRFVRAWAAARSDSTPISRAWSPTRRPRTCIGARWPTSASYIITPHGMLDTWALRQGHVLAYVAEAEVIHVHHETPRMVFNRYKREAMAFKRIFPESHFSVYDFLRLSFSNISGDWRQARHERALLQNSGSILQAGRSRPLRGHTMTAFSALAKMAIPMWYRPALSSS